MSVKLLTEHHLRFLSLKGGCTDFSQSMLVKMPHCWKSRDTAHIPFQIVVSQLTWRAIPLQPQPPLHTRPKQLLFVLRGMKQTQIPVLLPAKPVPHGQHHPAVLKLVSCYVANLIYTY